MQAALTNYTQVIIDASISSDEGLFGIARNGTIFEEFEMPPESEIQSKLEMTFKLRALKHILKIQVSSFIS